MKEITFNGEYSIKSDENGITISAPSITLNGKSVKTDQVEGVKLGNNIKTGVESLTNWSSVKANSDIEPEVIVPLSYIEKLIRENAELKLKVSDIKSLKIGNEIMLTEDSKIEWDKMKPFHNKNKSNNELADIIYDLIKATGIRD